MRLRNGYPTKKAMTEFMANHFKMPNSVYKPTYEAYRAGSFTWYSKYVQIGIIGFIEALKNAGLEIESYRPYESPTTGQIILTKQIRK